MDAPERPAGGDVQGVVGTPQREHRSSFWSSSGTGRCVWKGFANTNRTAVVVVILTKRPKRSVLRRRFLHDVSSRRSRSRPRLCNAPLAVVPVITRARFRTPKVMAKAVVARHLRRFLRPSQLCASLGEVTVAFDANYKLLVGGGGEIRRTSLELLLVLRKRFQTAGNWLTVRVFHVNLIVEIPHRPPHRLEMQHDWFDFSWLTQEFFFRKIIFIEVGFVVQK